MGIPFYIDIELKSYYTLGGHHKAYRKRSPYLALKGRVMMNSANAVATIEGPEGSQQWTESVRMYGREELEGMLAAAGLGVESVYGDYCREEYTHDSPRLILAGRKL